MARVVYTPADVKIGIGGVKRYNLDLNHDKVTDFLIVTSTYFFEGGSWWSKYLSAASGGVDGPNAAECGACLQSASALQRGHSVGPKKRFDRFGGMVKMFYSTGKTGRSVSGRWVNVKNRYLGLRFQINGKIHYGWARLSVRVLANGIAATLTGYAYETIPNKPIITGKTKGSDKIESQSPSATLSAPIQQPATLG